MNNKKIHTYRFQREREREHTSQSGNGRIETNPSLSPFFALDLLQSKGERNEERVYSVQVLLAGRLGKGLACLLGRLVSSRVVYRALLSDHTR